MRSAFLDVLLAIGLLPAVAAAAPADYARDVAPLLKARCSACHGALRAKSGLRLDAAALVRAGGDSGPAVVPGDSAHSLLIEKVSAGDDSRMPPPGEGEPLSEQQIALLRSWIDEGAAPPAGEIVPAGPAEHWAFHAPARPPMPGAANRAWVRNPVDAFLAAEHERRGLVPAPPAEKPVLLRRVYLDLIGLPPTRDELRAFLDDHGDDAYERVVDRLLASPQYGERWGRHWMDVWRYSDWYGYRASNEIRYSQRHIWRWRDWIVESLNADHGYDRMIVEMLAADEAAPSDPGALRATGYLGRNWYKFNRNSWLQDTVEHTAMGFLALTLKCCRCHDHKYEPVSQEEYYRFRAFFEPHDFRTDQVPGQGDVLVDGLSRVYDAKLDVPTYRFVRGDDRQPDVDHPLLPGVPEVLTGDLTIRPVPLPLESYAPFMRPFVLEEARAKAIAAAAAAGAALTAARQSAGAAAQRAAEPAAAPPTDPKAELESAQAALLLAEKQLASAVAEVSALAARTAAEKARYADPSSPELAGLAAAAAKEERKASLANAEQQAIAAELELASARRAQAAGDAKAAAAIAPAEQKVAASRQALEAARAAAAASDAAYTPLGVPFPSNSSGRRLALARWIADRNNPRTARVAVNHIWMRHFGQPLVASVANFGLGGKDPTHPALLDWLAVEFAEHGWSMKHLHRLLVTSNAYRMSSAWAGAAGLAADPQNRYLWRMNSRRMEAETVRDAILHLAGALDATQGGPELGESEASTSSRRSLYFRLTPDSKVELLELFDQANPNQCYERRESVLPQQALALANGALALTQARSLAGQLSRQGGGEPGEASDAAFITAAFEQTLGRAPRDDERAACLRFLDRHARLFADTSRLTPFPAGSEGAAAPSPEPRQRARENLLHVLFNHNDFVTVR